MALGHIHAEPRLVGPALMESLEDPQVFVRAQGNRAQATTECIATDVSVSPNVVRGVIQVNATCQMIKGKWYFIQMNNFTQPGI